MSEAITNLTRACDPTESLEPDDPRYVNLDEVRGESFVQGYARALWRANPARPEIMLFAGHRGVGKTCELKRLQRLLENPSGASKGFQPFLVIYVDVDPVVVDLNDIDWPDLLIHIAARVVKSLRDSYVPGFDNFTQYFRDRWDELKRTLGANVSITGAALETEIASLSLELRNRPSSRQLLRSEIERHGTGLQKALNDMLETASARLRADGKSGLVLLLDGLERMPRRSLGEGDADTHERLFIRRCTQWSSIKANMVMTIPISLLYTSGFAEITQNLGQSTRPVPMVRVHEFDDAVVRPDHPGMKKLVELVERRCQHASTTVADCFDDLGTLHYLCEQSGGHPRNLLVLLGSALNEIDEFPITRAIAESTVRNEANALVRELPDEYWKHLRKFERPTKECPSDEAHRSMLFLLHVFEYMNGEPWFQVNPILRSHPKFARVTP